MKTYQRTNWSNEQILKFLDGQKICCGDGTVDNYCQAHNSVIDDVKDFFSDFMRPQEEFGAMAYCVEDDVVVHVGNLPEPLRVPLENKCAISHNKENEKAFREIRSEGGHYCKVCGEDWP